MTLNIPDDDDAHLIFMLLPEDFDNEAEDWFITEMSEMSRHDSVQFLKDMSKMPDNIHNAVRAHKSRTTAQVRIQGGKRPKTLRLNYFKPTIERNIAKNVEWNPNVGGFEICIPPIRGKEDIRIIFDHIIESEVEASRDSGVITKEHLNPTQNALATTLFKTQSVISEMNYMKRREARMKETADSTNARIRYFSFISITILLGVTWVQISYLKGYFKKKKVL